MSGMLVRSVSLGIAIVAAPTLGVAIAARFRERLRDALEGRAVSMHAVTLDVAMLAAPIIVAAAATALVIGVAQTGGVMAMRRSRAKRAALLDGLRVYDAARSVVVTVALVGVELDGLVASAPDLARAIGSSEGSLAVAGTVLARIAGEALAVVLAAALLDVVVRRAAWIRRNSPSRAEANREHRDAEGDANLRRERRRAHEAMLDAPRDDRADTRRAQ